MRISCIRLYLRSKRRCPADFSLCIALRPDNADSYNGRGFVYGKKGDYDRAIEDFDRAIELDPSCSAAYQNRQLAYRKKIEPSA
ncbi:MAG: tetratricopeptide repeat protein [Treponema sp.]|jgi:lipoprotein NlpI|nr:tetratricopeptide repeat protein [Treponema sp.]